jgi:PadR family transcriptional regulator AphA
MPQQRGPELSLAEWLVLCLVSERPRHGFAIAGLLTDDGSLGRIWHVRKMVVYRAVHRLEQLGLIVASGKQPTSQGPARVPLQVTPEGRQAAAEWLARPAGHPRDIRSELLLKMALLDRVGADPRDLVRAQRRQFAPIAGALAGQIPATTGFDQVLLQ